MSLSQSVQPGFGQKTPRFSGFLSEMGRIGAGSARSPPVLASRLTLSSIDPPTDAST